MGTIVVTGAASGLGAAIAARLRDGGSAVLGADVARGDGVEVAADLATPEGRRALCEQVGERAGSDGLAGVVACAGVGPTTRDRGLIVAVNTFGALATLDGLLPLLAPGSAAVAIASNSLGLIPPPAALLDALLEGDEPGARLLAADLDGSTVYGVSKRALAIGVRRRAETWGGVGVRLNAVAPGPVDTPLLDATIDDPELGPLVDALPIPLGRRSQPAEIACVVAFLLSDASAYVHGSVLFADGGTDAQLRPDQV